LTKVLFRIRLSLTQPTKLKVFGLVYHCNFVEILFASMCSGKNYTIPLFLQVAIAWAKQAELVLKKIFFD